MTFRHNRFPNSHGLDTDHTSWFVNALSTFDNVGSKGEVVTVFYDATGLKEGEQFHVAFMRALSKTLVVVPFVTAAALQRMCVEGSVNSVDNVLLEWWLTLTLHQAKQGRVRAVLPVMCGEVRWEQVSIDETHLAVLDRSLRWTAARSRRLATCSMR